VSSYNALIGGLWNSGNRSKALEMTYNVLISCLCRDGMVNEAIGLMRDMESGGFRLAVCRERGDKGDRGDSTEIESQWEREQH